MAENNASFELETGAHEGQTGSVEDLIGLLESRSSAYALLARLYRKEIDQPLLDEMHGMLYPKNTGNDNVDEGNLLIATYLSNLWTDSVSELAVDFTNCFIGSGIDAFSAAYPYESVYTSGKRLLMQDARDEVLAVYRAYGVDKADDWTDAEDHVALELEFMKVLSDRAVEALRSEDEDTAYALIGAQRNFLADHLCKWVPKMVQDLKRFAQTKMYAGLAFLTEGYLETDRAFLDDLVGEGSATD